jgi:hypothetical protein
MTPRPASAACLSTCPLLAENRDLTAMVTFPSFPNSHRSSIADPAKPRQSCLARSLGCRGVPFPLILDALKIAEVLETANGYAARCDPRTFQALADMAEQHRSARLVSLFLRSLSRSMADGSVVVGDMTLDDWLDWAATKCDEHDPLAKGVAHLFETLVRS